MYAGTLFHCALFEPADLSKRYVTKPPGYDGRTKEGKAWAVAHAHLECVDAAQMRVALAQANAVRALPKSETLLFRRPGRDIGLLDRRRRPASSASAGPTGRARPATAA
jgi:hypothetical protein